MNKKQQYKGVNFMNKLTKIGVSALCGSLASIAAANAGTMEVIGGATATWSNADNTDQGSPLGMHSGLTFKGSGELDNGTTFTLTITGADQMAYSSGSIAMTVPSVGTIKINQASGGTGLDRFDDMMPTAWEETNGTSLGTGLQTVAGSGTSMNLEWDIDSGYLPEGLAIQLATAPGVGSGVVNDKAVAGDLGGVGSGFDVTVAYSGAMDGLNLFAGISSIEQDNSVASGKSEDREQYAAGATYAMGGFTVGYQVSMDDFSAKGTSAATQYYDNTAYGVSFAINDNLSVSYGRHDSERGIVSAGAVAPITLEAESVQLSYTMGGMSVKVAASSVDNASYTSGTANDKDGSTIALTLAF